MTEGATQYRSRCRIYADILRAIQENEPSKVTYLLHKANLSYERLLIHLSKMASLGLLERKLDGETAYYLMTPKGKKYLSQFRNVEEFGDAFGVEI